MFYGEEHRCLMASVTQFCEREIGPHYREWERDGAFPAHDLFAKMGELGFLGINKDPAFGGQGLDYSYQIAFVEALGGCGCASISLAVAVQTDMATPALARYGSDDLKQEFLAPAIDGRQICSLGVSEPGAGSDMSNIRTVARPDGGDYVINGTKTWITNATQADWICLLCRTSDNDGLLNKSLICVPMDLPGITVSPRLDKLGMHASDTAQIFFDDVRVPERNRIGSAGRGLLYQMETFADERLNVSASSLRAMERAIQLSIDHSRTRMTFGKPILDNQSVHFTFAELQAEVEALRSLIYRATDEMRDGSDATDLVCMAKLKAGRLQRQVTDSCLQYFGALGYMNDTPISQLFRDARLASIGGGSDEMMLIMISRLMNILPAGK